MFGGELGEISLIKQSNNTVTQSNRIRTKAGSLYSSSPVGEIEGGRAGDWSPVEIYIMIRFENVASQVVK